MPKPVVIGSRRSRLAMAQTEQVISQLQRLFPSQEFVIKAMMTSGDRVADRFSVGKGIFVKELEEALLAGTIDAAVHSMKDVPVEPRPGLTIAAMPRRADARDAFISFRAAAWETLATGSRVGTSSVRRAAQLLHCRPDVKMVDIRGNVDTRLRKLREGEYDALVLAVAGLERLGSADVITQRLPFSLMLPAPGQGALGIQIRLGNRSLFRMLRQLDHAATRCAVEAERAFLAALGGGCNTPAAAYGRLRAGKLLLTAMITQPDGTEMRRVQLRCTPRDPRGAGRKLFQTLQAKQIARESGYS